MVVTRHHQHAAVGRAAIDVAVLERIARTVHPWAFAVPHTKHALHGALGVAFYALRTQHLGGGQFFVDGGHKLNALFGKARASFPDGLVEHAQRRAPVAADEAARVPAARGVALALHQQQAHQGLGAGQEHLALGGPQAVGQLVAWARQRWLLGSGQRGSGQASVGHGRGAEHGRQGAQSAEEQRPQA